jgi:hypothetical protein
VRAAAHLLSTSCAVSVLSVSVVCAIFAPGCIVVGCCPFSTLSVYCESMPCMSFGVGCLRCHGWLPHPLLGRLRLLSGPRSPRGPPQPQPAGLDQGITSTEVGPPGVSAICTSFFCITSSAKIMGSPRGSQHPSNGRADPGRSRTEGQSGGLPRAGSRRPGGYSGMSLGWRGEGIGCCLWWCFGGALVVLLVVLLVCFGVAVHWVCVCSPSKGSGH